ncbi:hypothetical protein V6N11_015686 [Hibiscus sabdariffa]|uniref:Cytochrome P450 n=1 Tax=Hibiscus sabdariffa TaxID=183260 RepID=A0ABR2TTL8_9ROSI
MDILNGMLLWIAYLLVFLFATLVFFILKIYTGKSIHSPHYAPVKGTTFHQFLYFDHLYHHQLQVTLQHPTYRLLAIDHSDIFTSDTRNIEHVLKTNFKNYTRGKNREDTVADLWGDGFFAADGEKWMHQRKLLVSKFSRRVVTDFSCSVFRKHALSLVGAVSKMAASGQAIPIQGLVMKCSFHSMFEVGFGIDLKNLQSLSDEGNVFIKAFDDGNERLFTRLFDPFWKLKRFLNIGAEATFKKNVKIIDDFVYNVISTKKELLVSRRDYVSFLIRIRSYSTHDFFPEAINNECFLFGGLKDAKEDLLSGLLTTEIEKNPELMTDKYLRDITLNMIIAGKDSTAVALSWFFYVLCKYPLVQEKVAQEVMDITNSDGNIAAVDEFIPTITSATLDQMHYLHAAITETLRLFPPIPMDSRYVEEDDILPDGHRVKAGDEINYVTYAMARLPYIWGEDADCFRPERWLKNGVFQPESPFKFAGPQICLGKDFTYRQMKIYAIALIRYFRFKFADGMEDITYTTSFSLGMSKELHVWAVPRTMV